MTAMRKLAAEAERDALLERAKELHENGERLMRAADGWKEEAERLRMAYTGARDDLLMWKMRAESAEAKLREGVAALSKVRVYFDATRDGIDTYDDPVELERVEALFTDADAAVCALLSAAEREA